MEKEPVAWWQTLEGNRYTLWYKNPYEYGLAPSISVIPLYDGWEEKMRELESSLLNNQRIGCHEDGEFYIYEVYAPEPIIEEPPVEEDEESDVWSDIADAIREGINSY